MTEGTLKALTREEVHGKKANKGQKKWGEERKKYKDDGREEAEGRHK